MLMSVRGKAPLMVAAWDGWEAHGGLHLAAVTEGAFAL